MSIKRILAVVAIYLLACGGWVILGTATASRSSNFFFSLGSRVEGLWGGPVVQSAPSFAVTYPGTDRTQWVMPVANEVEVVLDADHRKKGLIWYPTFDSHFSGKYTVKNREEVAQKVRVHFDFPDPTGTYDNFALSVDDEPLETAIDTKNGVSEILEIGPGQSRVFHVAYSVRGMTEWRYRPAHEAGRVQNLNLTVKADFQDVDYTDGSLSPMDAVEADDGTTMRWQASDLITTADIGVIIPEKLNPGPLTTRITFFAPVCLLFFFVLVATMDIMYQVRVHPMHYLFVAAGFFAFHLLLSYMAGLVHVHLSFIIAALTSVVLVTTYLRAALGGRLPWRVAVGGQLFFLVLFSYSFFLRGMTGLTVAIGSVVTLGVLMKVTAHVDWEDVFRRERTASTPPVPPSVPAIQAQ